MSSMTLDFISSRDFAAPIATSFLVISLVSNLSLDRHEKNNESNTFTTMLEHWAVKLGAPGWAS